MSEQPPPLPNAGPTPEAPTLAPSKTRQIALAFQSVFGQPSRRSNDQRIVLEHLRKCCGRDAPIFQPDKNGNFDPLRAAQIDGAQTQYLIVKRQLAIARKLSEVEKGKPKVKTKRDE
jgi:hypothetical protein